MDEATSTVTLRRPADASGVPPEPPGLNVRVNGYDAALPGAAAGRPLLSVLREEFGLMGANFGCRKGGCGACAVLVDGQMTTSCAITVGDVADRDVLTIEGLAADGENRVIAAFAEEQVIECGYAWPGMIMAASALLARSWRPTDAEIAVAMRAASDLCGECPRVRRAIRRAAGCP